MVAQNNKYKNGKKIMRSHRVA